MDLDPWGWNTGHAWYLANVSGLGLSRGRGLGWVKQRRGIRSSARVTGVCQVADFDHGRSIPIPSKHGNPL